MEDHSEEGKTELRSVDDKELANCAKNRGKSSLIRGNSMCKDQEVGKDLAVWLGLGKLVSRCDMVMDREGEARICRAQESSLDLCLSVSGIHWWVLSKASI